MTPCPCGSFVRPGDPCPACGAATSRALPSAAAVVLGLVLAGCADGQKTDDIQSDYGTPMTDTEDASGDTADTGE